jgi:hypothetical protein
MNGPLGEELSREGKIPLPLAEGEEEELVELAEGEEEAKGVDEPAPLPPVPATREERGGEEEVLEALPGGRQVGGPTLPLAEPMRGGARSSARHNDMHYKVKYLKYKAKYLGLRSRY